VFSFRLGRVVMSAVAGLLLAAFSTALPAVAQPASSSPEKLIAFDIESQPLASALDRYGDATGREVFYDTALAEGRKSGVVEGEFTPEAALRMLLEGTGLSARFLADDSFVLLPIPAQDRPRAVQAAPPAAHRAYYARIQASLRDAFCRSGEVRPGGFRVVAVFWIGASGAIERYQRLGSAGADDIDRGIDAALRDTRLSEPPPAGFAQPVLIMVVPQAPGVTMGCGSGTGAVRSVGVRP
jgi:hypothetical protein